MLPTGPVAYSSVPASNRDHETTQLPRWCRRSRADGLGFTDARRGSSEGHRNQFAPPAERFTGNAQGRHALQSAGANWRAGLGHRSRRLPHCQPRPRGICVHSPDPCGHRPGHHVHGQLLGLPRRRERAPHGPGLEPERVSPAGLPDDENRWPHQGSGHPSDRHVPSAPPHGSRRSATASRSPAL
jgi:hypothetical protein